ncbi:MAG: aminoglycoside phosphotransferase family protein [bacterium]|nr:aminoglycoside phosphotransferase family protein [bacterium]
MQLPVVRTKDEYRARFAHEHSWRPALEAITSRHGLTGVPRRLTLGTHLVYDVDGVVIKLFCPMWPEDFQAERAALLSIRDLPTPQILEQGELAQDGLPGWPYLLLTPVAGTPAAAVWPDLTLDVRRGLMQQIGALLRRLHDQDLATALDQNWPGFLAQRLHNADNHHSAEEPWRSWIQAQLAGFAEPPYEPVLLHADLTLDHFLLRQHHGTWSVSGLIDFGDARIGHPFYDFVAILVDYTLGVPELSQALLASYGLPATAAVTDSLTRYCLVHEFLTLKDLRNTIPMATPEDLHRVLWG